MVSAKQVVNKRNNRRIDIEVGHWESKGEWHVIKLSLKKVVSI